MLMSQKVRRITGCESLTKYFKPISKQRYEVEQAYQAILDEEKAEERRIIVLNRINQREEERKLRATQQQRERRQRNRMHQEEIDPLQAIRNSIDDGVADVVVSNESTSSSKNKKRKWNSRPDNWTVIAEQARDFGDNSAVRDFKEVFEGFSPARNSLLMLMITT